MHQMMMTMMMYQNNDNNSDKSNGNNSNNAPSSYVPSTNDTSIRRDSYELGSMNASGLSFTKLLVKDGGAEMEDWGMSEMGMTISSDMFSVVGAKGGAPQQPQQHQPPSTEGSAGAGLPTTNTLPGGYDGMLPPGNAVAAAVPLAKNSSDTLSRTGGGGGGMGGTSSIWLQKQHHQQRQEGTPYSSASTTPRTPKNFSMDENAFNESFKSMDMEDRPSSRKWTPTRTAATAAACGGGVGSSGGITRGEQPSRGGRPDPDGVMGPTSSRSTSRNKCFRRSTLDSIESLNLGDLMQSRDGVLVDSSMGNIHNMPSNLDLGISLTSLMSFQSVKSDKNDDNKSGYWLNQFNAIDSVVFEGGDEPHTNPWEQDEQDVAPAVDSKDTRGVSAS